MRFCYFLMLNSQLLIFNSTIIFKEKSKNTILGFTFCPICNCASLSSSIMPITFRSLTNGAKRVENFVLRDHIH